MIPYNLSGAYVSIPATKINFIWGTRLGEIKSFCDSKNITWIMLYLYHTTERHAIWGCVSSRADQKTPEHLEV